MSESFRMRDKILIISLAANLAFLAFLGVIVTQHNDLRTQLNELTETYRFLLQQMNTTPVSGVSTINIVAVKTIQAGFQTTYEGVVMNATVELVIGEGRILVNTQPRIGIDIQTSARIAALVTESLTGITLSQTDIILTITSGEEVDVVDGPSAGAAITVAMLAAVEGQPINSTIFMTGTINSDTTVGTVGGIVEKAVAAAETGASYFLVPQGQGTVVLLAPKATRWGPWTIITYDQQHIKLQDYLAEHGYSTRVIEIDGIEEAYDQFTA